MNQGKRRKAGSFVPEVVTKSFAEGTLPKPPGRQAEKRTIERKSVYAATVIRFIFNRASR